MKKFITGKEYSCRSICDYNCIWTFTIVKRTNKSVWIKIDGKVVRRKIDVYNDMETIYPFETYSMAPVLSAN